MSMNYKNWRTSEVISESDYNKLPYAKKCDFTRVYRESITHQINDSSGSDFLLGAIIDSSFSSFGSSSDFGYSDSSSCSSFDSFGGGDFGGGGGGSDF